MAHPSARRLERLLDQVEQILAERGWDGEAPYAFLKEDNQQVTSLELPVGKSEGGREAIAAIVLHRMLQMGADRCAVAVPAPRDQGVYYLDGHSLGPAGVHSIRRRVRLPKISSTLPIRLSA
jgi:hypothetical protein